MQDIILNPPWPDQVQQNYAIATDACTAALVELFMASEQIHAVAKMARKAIEAMPDQRFKHRGPPATFYGWNEELDFLSPEPPRKRRARVQP
jgi:hypothetical protein